MCRAWGFEKVKLIKKNVAETPLLDMDQLRI